MRKYFKAFLLTVFVSLALYKPLLGIEFEIYVSVCGAFLIFAAILYCVKKSCEIFLYLSVCLITNLGIYLLYKCFDGYRIVYDGHRIILDTIDICYIVYAAFLCGALILTIIFLSVQKPKQKRVVNFFSERTSDLERLKKYLNYTKAVGVIGYYGSGKTFLCDMLKQDEEAKKEYLFLTVDLLSLRVENLQSYILNELDKLLDTNRIFSVASSSLKRILSSENIVSVVSGFLDFSNLSYAETIETLKNEIKRTGKKLCIFVEDLDRLSDEDTVKTVFDIFDKLTCEYIKVVYQYSQKNLENIKDTDGEVVFNKRFVERYVPYSVNLSYIPFFRIIQHVLENGDYENINLKDFDFMQYDFYLDPYLSGQTGYSSLVNFEPSNFSIRTVEIFLKEISMSSKTVMEKNKQTVIVFYLLKHFYREMYDSLKPNIALSEQLKITSRYGTCSIFDFIKMCEQKAFSDNEIKDVISNEKNKNNICALQLMGYKFEIYQIKKDSNSRSTAEYTNEDVKNLRNKNINEKIDRIVWNLLCSSKDEYTDYEYVANSLIEQVLELPFEQQQEAFDIWHRTMIEETPEHNPILTIIAIPHWVHIFQIFGALGTDSETWIKLLRLMFFQEKHKKINSDVLECLEYCDLSQKKVFFYAIENYCRLEITSNYNNAKCYCIFLKKYLQSIWTNGFIEGSFGGAWEVFDRNIREKELFEKNLLLNAMEKIADFFEKKATESFISEIEDIKKECLLIKEFINKNMALIRTEKQAKNVDQIDFRTEMSSSYPHQEEMDRIAGLKLGKDGFISELGKAYREGKLLPVEVEIVFKKCGFGEGEV